MTKAALPSTRPGAVRDQSDEEGEGPPAGGRADTGPPLPGTSVDTRQMTEKRFTI